MNIFYKDLPVYFKDSILISLICISLVFLILTLISLIISLFKFIPHNKGVKEIKKEIKNNSINLGIDINKLNSTEKVAVFTALIDFSRDNKNTNVKVKSIKEI